jgi:predicted N-acyltransferase
VAALFVQGGGGRVFQKVRGMTTIPSLVCTWHSSIGEIEAEQWNGLCRERDRPFLQWEWLRLLENSGSVGSEIGWRPSHLTVRSKQGLVGAAALYVKAHSEGEFVFDHAWAQLASNMGIGYYPKMVGMSPFTPVTAYRFLIAPQADETLLSLVMCREIESFCRINGIFGCSFHFVTPRWGRILKKDGYLAWLHQGFVWFNAGLSVFEDYLSGLSTNCRRNIRRERRRLRASGIRVLRLFAQEVPDAYFALMHDFYARHNERFGQWSCKFLTPAFFEGLRTHFRDNILMIVAFGPDETEPLAMALLIVSGDRVFGRYWGAREEVEFLHFELCYYQPMQWMIELGLRWFDPGMGGVHKAFRGFISAPTYSLYKFYDLRLHGIMGSYIPEYNHMEMMNIMALNSILPYRQQRV